MLLTCPLDRKPVLSSVWRKRCTNTREEKERNMPTFKGTLITGDEVTFHESPARKDIVLPHGISYEEAYAIFERMHIASETVEQLEPVTYPNRPNDVAAAVARVIHRMFGVAVGKATQTMFGENPPTFKSIPVFLTETIEVATGPIGLPSLDKATIMVGEAKDKEHGVVG